VRDQEDEPEPEVNITANNSNGPITVDYDSRVTLRWTSSDVDYCYASNDWSGDKNSSGLQLVLIVTLLIVMDQKVQPQIQ